MPRDIPTIDLEAAFTDHDRLFKELLTVFFLDFIDLFLPDVAAYIDRSTITFLNTEVFSNVSTGEKHIVDVLVRARFLDEEAFFLVHVENQSKMQPDFAERMFLYFADLVRTHRVPVYPIALLTYDRPLRACPNQYRVSFRGFEPLQFNYRTIQLNRLNWSDFLDRPNPIAVALMAKMKIAPRDRPRVKLACLRILATLKLDPARTQLLSGFVDSYLKLSSSQRQEFEAELAALSPEERSATMPLTISWKEEGRLQGLAEGEAKGRAEGREEGRVTGALELLVRVGENRLGAPEPQTLAALAAIASPERLADLAGRILDVQTWNELLAGA